MLQCPLTQAWAKASVGPTPGTQVGLSPHRGGIAPSPGHTGMSSRPWMCPRAGRRGDWEGPRGQGLWLQMCQELPGTGSSVGPGAHLELVPEGDGPRIQLPPGSGSQSQETLEHQLLTHGPRSERCGRDATSWWAGLSMTWKGQGPLGSLGPSTQGRVRSVSGVMGAPQRSLS